MTQDSTEPGPTEPLVARFRVDAFEPREVDGVGDWSGVLIFRKTFTAGITGSATTLFQAAGAEGSRGYVATERIVGTAPDGRQGELTVQHGGLESDPGATFGRIVPQTGTGGFEGWTGSALIHHDDNGAYFEFDLE